jgi:menaquinone-9 beta-reductase
MVEGTDVFVVGGGPAGLAAAIAARREGFRVVVADGAQPPIDKACGEGLLPDTIASLRELGVSLPASEGYSLRGIRFVGRDSEVASSFPDGGLGVGVRRPALHQRLVERATELGVSMRWGAPVNGISGEGVVVGGEVVQARWIVGADGMGSRVRKWTGLEAGRWLTGGRRFAHRQHYRVAPWADFMEIYWGENAQAYVTPVGKTEVCVVTISRDAAVRCEAIGEKFPRLARRLVAASVSPGTKGGAVTMMQSLRSVHRGKIALVGDASGSVDAITGEGLHLGFRQAIELGQALNANDLRRYAKAHRRLARRPTLMGRLMLLLDGRAGLRERTLRALASDADMFARLVAIHVGARSTVDLAPAGARLGWRFVAA